MSDTSANNKRNLDEVSFIRPILIVLLFFVHCFTVFNGGWPPFEGYKDCTGYMWFSRTCYSFMLETFIFVSGYVWAYSVIDLQKRSSLGILVKKKAERLILPSVVFSLVYWQLFNGDITDLVGGGKIVISVLSGVGHLWYLPVLFWCFVSLWIVEKLKISDKVKLFILLVLALLPYPYIPFQLSRLPYYFLFFFAGFKVWQYGGLFRTNISSKKVLASWLLFVVSFVVLRMLKSHVVELYSTAPLVTKAGLKIVSTICQIGYSSLGVIAIYSMAVLFTNTHNLPKCYINAGSLCFGVYVFQEFIIKYLYYYTELPVKVGYLALPWIAFIITLVLSLLLSKTTKSL